MKHACNYFIFHDLFILKTLYCSLICSNLKYYPLIWINNALNQNELMEFVQNNFLHCMSFKCNIPT